MMDDDRIQFVDLITPDQEFEDGPILQAPPQMKAASA
jgi:hypothetical protein